MILWEFHYEMCEETFMINKESNLEESFSNIIQLHMIFINHDSIYVYGYLCKSGSE